MLGEEKHLKCYRGLYVAQTTIHLIGLTKTTTKNPRHEQKHRKREQRGRKKQTTTATKSHSRTMLDGKRRKKTRLNVMESIRQHFEYGNMKLCSIFWLKCFLVFWEHSDFFPFASLSFVISVLLLFLFLLLLRLFLILFTTTFEMCKLTKFKHTIV